MTPRRAVLGGALAIPALRLARAQGWVPQRPIRMVVPFAPGGILDQLARLIAEPMGRRLGQPLVVENRPGAGGNVGTLLVARARGDAHTVLVGSSGPLAISPITEAHLGYDPLADLIPITLLNATPLVLVVRSASPHRDVAGLVAALKAEGREVLYPTPGVGSPQLLAQEAFRQAAGFPAAPVHYPGSAPAVLAVIAGEFPFTIGFCQNFRQTRRHEVKAEFSLRCFENNEHTAGTTQVKQATAAGGDMLVVAGGGTEETAEFIVASTETLR